MYTILVLTNLILLNLNNNPIHGVNDKPLMTGWYHSNSDRTGELRIFEYINDSIYVNPTPIVTFSSFDRLEISEASWSKGEYMLTIWLDEEGIKKWGEATEMAMSTRTDLVFILDNEIVSTARVMAKMTNGATSIYRADLSKEDLEEIKQMLSSSK